MTETIESIAAEWKDGQEIPHFQAVNHPVIMEFIRKYPQCFKYKPNLDAWIYHKNGNAE